MHELSFRTSNQNSTRPAKPRLRINSEDFVGGDDAGHSSAQNNANETNANEQLDQVTLHTVADDMSAD